MKLTNYMRDAFVRAAMADVPKVDYDELMQKAAEAAALAVMPEAMREAYKKHPHFFAADRIYIKSAGGFVLPINENVELRKEDVDEIVKLDKAKDAQDDARHELEMKLRAVAKSCTTREKLLAALPEFEKYLPAADAEKCNTLPALANVVSDFVKAGWPKSVQA